MQDQETTTIIQTKLNRPPLPVDMVRRPRLTSWLEQRRARPLTLVSAPAGYGKSTLVSNWLEGCGKPAAWLSIDENDDTIKALRRDSVLSLEKVYKALVAGDKQGVVNGLNHHFNSYLQTVISHLIGGFGMAEYLKEKA